MTGPGDRLQQAGSRLRELMASSVPEPWGFACGPNVAHVWCNVHTTDGRVDRYIAWPRLLNGRQQVGEHLATLELIVALRRAASPVVDWLLDTGETHRPDGLPGGEPWGCAECYPHDGSWPCGTFEDALTVAEAVLASDGVCGV